MALQKQPVSINFGQGVDTKTDPYQVQVGKFLSLVNSVFTSGGRLTKRNGYPQLTTLPNANQTTLTTLNDNLLATGSNLYAFSADTNQWLNKGVVQPVQLEVQSLVRSSASQTSPDTAVASNGLTCVGYIENGAGYYQIIDSATGQQIIGRTLLSPASGNVRTFVLGRFFIVTYTATISSANHLQYVAIPLSVPTLPLAAVDISTTLNTLNAGYDGIVANNNLYISWSDNGSVIRTTRLDSTLHLYLPEFVAGHTASLVSVTADTSASTAVIWVSFWDSGSHNGYSVAYNQTLLPVLGLTQWLTSTVINSLTSIATNGVITLFYENYNTYASPYPTANVQTDFISENTVTQTGTVGTASVVLRSVGLASKPFYGVDGTIYLLATYGDVNQDITVPSMDQPTYFLIDSLGNIYMRMAYSNGGGYAVSQVLPTVSYQNGTYYVPYSIADLLTTVNKSTAASSGPTSSIYTQTGVNLAKFTINTVGQYSSEIANALHLTGGQLWEFDGVKPVEHGFHVWPDNVAVTTTATGGSITAQQYFYQFTYEWTDNAGLIHRSAPSVPLSVTTTGSTSVNTLYVPTLRLTYKTAPNSVRIVGYRWSVAQQIYYQFTSVQSPTLNDPTIDFVTITDTLADFSILGNAIIYTTGGVIEDIAAPASIASALFNNRLWLVDAEDRNLLWYSKQVIEGTPVEMSDLLTFYVAPTTGAQGSTGPITALSAMDDKLIIFKKDAIYYINGIGPDNTGANSAYSDPVYITASVGCANPNSIVLMPQGLMFQSDKGIWLLGRDLSTQYIGAPVEIYNSQTITAAQAIPGTNQVRFVLNDSMTLMYDYFYQQWGTFTNLQAISATLYQGLHTYLNQYGAVFQEQPSSYLDGSNPVLMSFTTSWISLAGLQGYERFYFMYMLGTYYTPFKLNVQLAYNYNSAATQAVSVTPNNYTPDWGGEPVWGAGAAWGSDVDPSSSSTANIFSARVFPSTQKCETFQVSISEVYDSTYGAAAGQGLSLSGLNLVVGIKKGYRTQSAGRSFG